MMTVGAAFESHEYWAAMVPAFSRTWSEMPVDYLALDPDGAAEIMTYASTPTSPELDYLAAKVHLVNGRLVAQTALVWTHGTDAYPDEIQIPPCDNFASLLRQPAVRTALAKVRADILAGKLENFIRVLE